MGSVAMFNKNPSVGDAPLDAPADPTEYTEAVRAKFRSLFAAAVVAGSTVLVMPDAGCGVYQNDPVVVGRIFGEVLRREFWGGLKEVALCGSNKFIEAVVQATTKFASRGSSHNNKILFLA